VGGVGGPPVPSFSEPLNEDELQPIKMPRIKAVGATIKTAKIHLSSWLKVRTPLKEEL
jgi:hypothetical protein